MTISDKTDFTIVLVDDNIDARMPQMAEIKTFLKEKDMNLILLKDEENGDKVEEYINSNDVDIVVTDNSMQNEGDGLKVIKKVREKSELIDLLLFSANGLIITDFQQACLHTAVEIVDDENIVDELESLIRRNLSKWDDIIFLRGFIISKIIDIEQMINTIFSNYFKVHESKTIHFNDLILENSANSLGGKKKALWKLLDSLGKLELVDNISKKIQKLQEDRNVLAHCKVKENEPNCLISMGDRKEFHKQDMQEIFEKIREISEKLTLVDEEIKNLAPVVTDQENNESIT